MGAAAEITAEAFERDVEGAAGTVLVDFWSPTCAPCRALAPILDQVAADRPDVRVVKINTADHPELSERHGVRALPTMLVLKDGAEIQRIVGVKPKATLLAALDAA